MRMREYRRAVLAKLPRAFHCAPDSDCDFHVVKLRKAGGWYVLGKGNTVRACWRGAYERLEPLLDIN